MKNKLLLSLVLPFLSTPVACTENKTYDIYNGDLWVNEKEGISDSHSIIQNDPKMLYKVKHYNNFDEIIPLIGIYKNNVFSTRWQNFFLKNVTIYYQWTQNQIDNYSE